MDAHFAVYFQNPNPPSRACAQNGWIKSEMAGGDRRRAYDDIVACVASNLRDMKHHLGDGLDAIFISEFISRASSQDQRVTTHSIPTAINWAGLIQNETVNLRARLESMKKDKVIFQWPKS